MSVEENKAIARRVFDEIWSMGKLDVIKEVFAPDCIYHAPFPSKEIRIVPVYARRVTVERESFPDLSFMIDDQIAEGDKVVIRWTLNGTHKGQFMGLPGTGKGTTMMGISIFRISNGKITDIWMLADELSWIQQMGGTMPEGFSRLDPGDPKK